MEIKDSSTEILKQAPTSLPEFTTATLKTYDSITRTNKTVASQMVSLDGVILSREFSETDNSEEQDSYLEEVKLGYYDPRYKGSTYYIVRMGYSEISYYSNNMWTDPSDPSYFLRWKRTLNKFRAELTYLDIEVDRFSWKRPPLQVTTSSTNQPVLYIPLPSPFLVVSANVGSAVRSSVSSNWPLKVYRGGEIVENYSSILMTDPNLEVYIEGEPPINLPITVTIVLYGEYAWTSIYPVSSGEPQVLIHPIESQNKLQPPGKNFSANFWNTNPKQNVMSNYQSRSSQPPSFNVPPTPAPTI